MNYNTDGFNNRTNYIRNVNDMNGLKKMGPSNADSSFAKMKVQENKPNIKTVTNEQKFVKEFAKGSKDNFVLRNNNMMNANRKANSNNPVSNAMNRNMLKKF